MSQNLEELTHALLHAAKKAGADSADAMAVKGTALSIDVRNGVLEQADRSEGVDIGLRILIGQRQACVSSSNTSQQTIEAMCERAVAMAKEAPEDPFVGLANDSMLSDARGADGLELSDTSPEPAPAELQDDAMRAEAAALDFEGISQVQAASGGYSAREVHISATNGFTGGYQRTDRATSCVAIAGTGAQMERDYDGDSRIFQSDLRDAGDIGKSAAERALARIGATKPPTGSFPVLFDERISSTLIGHLLAAVNGASISRGSSWLRDALGEQVLPEHLSLIEDPHRPRIPGSRLFDGEGLPTQKRAIIQNGILTGWTLDLANARKLNMASSSNAARGTSAPPSPSNWNIELTQGQKSREELIHDMGTGLLVTSMIGSTISPTTGDYSRGAAGFWIENGEITHPVNECTIAGNLRDMLMRMTPANDARQHLSRVVPSLLVEGMTLAGN
ncbi:TldD/PmbA family protein [Planktotalea sp.]|uniref:TldD/PmbA family protein n=1 Tax=Planktotalea sp. TaxID=2029877 RepID=UPI0025EFE59C|nr:TldD/PmbA family protein [Planktotalea sp.]